MSFTLFRECSLLFTGWHVKVEQINCEISATKKEIQEISRQFDLFIYCSNPPFFIENYVKELADGRSEIHEKKINAGSQKFSFYQKSFYDFLSILNFDFSFYSCTERRRKNFRRWVEKHGKNVSDFFSLPLLLLRHIQLKQSSIDETTRNQMTKEKERQTPASKPSKVELRNNKNINSKNVFLLCASLAFDFLDIISS